MFTDLITIDTLMDLAGKKVFWRGKDYYADNAVGRVRVIGDTIKAQVRGSEIYQVELSEHNGRLVCHCTCPHADEGNFCKHCVAVGLAWLGGAADRPDSDGEDENKTIAGKGRRIDPWQAIQSYLEAQPHETLTALLLDLARRDDRLYQSLLLKAERGHAGTDQARRFRRAIKAATHGVEA